MFQTFNSIEHQSPFVGRNIGGSLILHIKIKGIRNFFEKIKDKVGTLHGCYGVTEFSVIDPTNFTLTFAEDE